MVLFPAIEVFSATINPPSVATNSTSTTSETVTGLQVSDVCALIPAGVLTSSGTNVEAEGVTFYTSQVDTADTLPVHWVNATTTTRDLASQTFFVVVLNRFKNTGFFGPTS